MQGVDWYDCGGGHGYTTDSGGGHGYTNWGVSKGLDVWPISMHDTLTLFTYINTSTHERFSYDH